MLETKNDPLTSAPADLVLNLTRIFNAPRHLVFAACTQKEHLDQWMCPDGFTIPASAGDFRPGGEWHCLMISPKGERFPVGGIYKEIVPDELIVFSHAWEDDAGKPEHETTVTLRFEDAGPGKTRLTLEQSFFKSAESREGHMGGWTQCLEKLNIVISKLQD